MVNTSQRGEGMKRLRDDAHLSPQFQRPFGPPSRVESNGPPNPSVSNGSGGGGVGGGGSSVGGVGRDSANGVVGNGGGAHVVASGTQKLTTNDALTYLKEVKDMFQDQREKYDRFLDVMKDFKAQRVDTAGVIRQVKELFKGRPNLILGFNTFLPKGYEITLTDEDEFQPRRTVEFEEAISFVNKIKKRFQNNDHVYKSFLEILNMYRKEHKGITEVYQEVASLFNDQPDLLDEFTRFLPDTSSAAAAPSSTNASLGRNSFHRGDERSSIVPPMRESQIDKQRPRRDIIAGSHREPDHSIEHPDSNDDKSVMKLHKEQKRHVERENMNSKRNCDQGDRNHDSENNGDVIMHRSSEKRKPARKVEDFVGSSNLALHDNKDEWKSMYRKEFRFFEKVKERLCSADDYQAFLKCINIYSTEIITKKELQSLVGDLIGKYTDLMDGFNEFLESCEGMDEFLAGVMGKKPIRSGENSSKALKIEEKEKAPKREVVEGGKEKERYNLKYWEKSIQELDLSSCKRCTSSYRLLPEDYPIPSASQRSELGAQVLNDHWVSVTSGSEDYSFKHMRRNQYEESLFRCEDDRFELDMLLESVNSTVKRAEELLNGITNKTVGSDGPIKVEEYFTALNLRCIERLYGDHGLDVVDILRKNAALALPVVLIRLKQKLDEWTKCRFDFNKIWADIYSKNHYKSLDHRSFYFKQQDSKNLSAKALVTEIKEIKDRKKEDEVLLSIAAGNRHILTTDLKFEYPDTEIHEDIHKIIKYSCEEICSTKEQFNKVMHLWTSFLEPLLGVHFTPEGSSVSTEDYNNDTSNLRVVKNTALESEGSKDAKSNGDRSKLSQHMSFRQVAVKNGDGFANGWPNLASSERLASSDIAVKSGSDANHGHGPSSSRVNNGNEETNGLKSTAEDMCSEVLEKLRLNRLTSGGPLTGHKEDSVGGCKNDKEEGELSPNGDLEDNFGTSQNPPKKHCTANGIKQREMRMHEDNFMAADDEDSGHVSEAGVDISGSESAAGECSKDEDDGEHEGVDAKGESEGEAENVTDGVLMAQSECFLMNCKPLSKFVAYPSVSANKRGGGVFYGNDAFYVLLRLHQALYERILAAKVNSVCGESKRKMAKDENSEPYARFMSALFSLLDGSSDNSKFEDDCRLLIGTQSYVLFTLDKLIYKLVKQLQTISSDEMDYKLIQLYEYETSRKPEKCLDSVYYENVHVLLHEENIYRLECTSHPMRLTMQLMDDGSDKSETIAVSIDPNFACYLHNEYLLVDHRKKELSKVFLKRNLQKYANLDEFTALYSATENTLIMNGLECKMSATTLKISYVLDTEDHFIRFGRRRGNKPIGKLTSKGQRKVQKFNQFLAASRDKY